MSRKTTFEVYTYFGRVVARFTCNHDKETHHRAAEEEARKACFNYPGQAWVRIV
tara:strand:- start:9 stop:170 length:162 start_codon:yes stop_codon:yes gene_type:complete